MHRKFCPVRFALAVRVLPSTMRVSMVTLLSAACYCASRAAAGDRPMVVKRPKPMVRPPPPASNDAAAARRGLGAAAANRSDDELLDARPARRPRFIPSGGSYQSALGVELVAERGDVSAV